MAFGDANKSLLGSRWVKVTEGDPLTCVFLGDERIDKAKFYNGKGYRVDPDGNQRFAVNVWIVDQDRVAIFEGPGGMARAIYAKRPTDKSVVTIDRKGSGPNSEYIVKIERDVTDEEYAKATAHPLHDLSELWRWEDEPAAPSEDTRPEGQIPF